ANSEVPWKSAERRRKTWAQFWTQTRKYRAIRTGTQRTCHCETRLQNRTVRHSTPLDKTGVREAPHLPRPAPIEAYGEGGFRFAGMSHRGSLLCFPDGIWAWPVMDVSELNERVLQAAFDRAERLDFFLIGAGRNPWPMPEDLRQRFRELSLSVD